MNDVNRDATMSYLRGMLQAATNAYAYSPTEENLRETQRFQSAIAIAHQLMPSDFELLARGPMKLLPDVILKISAERSKDTDRYVRTIADQIKHESEGGTRTGRMPRAELTGGPAGNAIGHAIGSRSTEENSGEGRPGRSVGISHPEMDRQQPRSIPPDTDRVHPQRLDDLGPYGRGSQGEQMNKGGDKPDATQE